jgi:hypothetical protein
MLIEHDWLNILGDRSANKGYVIQADLLTAYQDTLVLFQLEWIFQGARAHNRPRPPHFRGFAITLRHTTLGRTSLYE